MLLPFEFQYFSLDFQTLNIVKVALKVRSNRNANGSENQSTDNDDKEGLKLLGIYVTVETKRASFKIIRELF
jgi:hypothetical protein